MDHWSFPYWKGSFDGVVRPTDSQLNEPASLLTYLSPDPFAALRIACSQAPGRVPTVAPDRGRRYVCPYMTGLRFYGTVPVAVSWTTRVEYYGRRFPKGFGRWPLRDVLDDPDVILAAIQGHGFNEGMTHDDGFSQWALLGDPVPAGMIWWRTLEWFNE